MERAHRLEAHSLEQAKDKQNSRHSNADNQQETAGHSAAHLTIPASQVPQEQINIRELSVELARELTTAFATWTSTVVEELAKAFQRLTVPFHQKLSGEMNAVQQKALEVLVALADLRNSNSR